MKKLLFVFMFASLSTGAQHLPSDPANGFSFPIGTKFTLALHPVDSTRFDVSVVAWESFQEVVNAFETDDLFAEKGAPGTIDFYFCLGTMGEKEGEGDENTQVLLLFKNRSSYALSYTSEIQVEEGGGFQPTSNAGSFPGVVTSELWPYVIYQIRLQDFMVRK